MSPTRAVWTVAWPMAALGLLRSFYYLTDSFWVGKLGPTQLAALGGSAFGVCEDCSLFSAQNIPDGGHMCGLTSEPLSVDDSHRICVNFRPSGESG